MFSDWRQIVFSIGEKALKLLNKIVLIGFLLFNFNAKAEEFRFGISGGLNFADVGDYSADVAQAIANATGSTTTYTYDRATWGGRIFGEYDLGSGLSIEAGYFLTGDIDINYTIPGASASEAFSGSGLDFAGKYTFPEENIYVKAGLHDSSLNYASSITIGGTNVNLGTIETEGTGGLFGIGYIIETKEDGSSSFVGYDLYSSVGGVSDADFGYLYYGLSF